MTRRTRTVGLLALAAIQVAVVVVIFTTRLPDYPEVSHLERLDERYEIVDEGIIRCGSGGTVDCGWTFSLRHQQTEERLVSDLQAAGFDESVRIETNDGGTTTVRTGWIESDGDLIWGPLGILLICGASVCALAAILRLAYDWYYKPRQHAV